MKGSWPIVRMGEILTPRKEFIIIDDLQTYKRARVQLRAQGIVLRDEVPGAMIKTKKQQLCRAGEFLVAEIDAKVGGFGIVPKELEGAIVSSHYFLFGAKDDRLDRRFLDSFIKTGTFRQQVEAQGSTNYAAIRPADVLSYSMPLPPLTEQRRIVARIEELAAKIAEARLLRNQACSEVGALSASLLRSEFASLRSSTGLTPIGDLLVDAGYGSSEKCLAQRDDGDVPVLRIPNVASEKIEFSGLKFAALSPRDFDRVRLAEGDILVVRTNGSLDLVGRSAVVDELPEPAAFASYLIRLRFDTTRILPHFAQRMLRSLRMAGEMIDLARTTAGQYNVSLGRLRSARIPVPPLLEQSRIVALLDGLQAKTNALKLLQTETTFELNAMLPTILDRAFKGEL